MRWLGTARWAQGQAPSSLPQLWGDGGTSLLATGGQASWDGTDLWEAPKPLRC